MNDRNNRSRWVRHAIGILALAFLVEAGSFAAGKILQHKWGMYRDAVSSYSGRKARDYADYLELCDRELGWPYPSQFGSDDIQPDGSIRVPANVSFPGDIRISLYGDSFTWGLTNTTHEEAWASKLAHALRMQVKNWGVGGYGSDQAFLRFRQNWHDTSTVAVFGHMSENMIRNLTRLRDFTGGGEAGFSFKPRFTLGPSGELELVPKPHLSESEYLRFLGVRTPQLILPHENFHPGGPTGVTRLTFPFTLAVLRNLGYWRLRARLGGYPEYQPFYEADHPLEGLYLTVKILTTFASEARARGQRALIVLFPGPEDARLFQLQGVNIMAGLADRVRAAGVDVLDFTPILTGYLAGRSTDEAYRNSHFVPEIDAVIATAVAARIQALLSHH